MKSINHYRCTRQIYGFFCFAAISVFTCLFLLGVEAYADEAFYSIALSSYSNAKKAESEVSKLKDGGFHAFYRMEKGKDNKGPIYQVYIEKYKLKDEAKAEAKVFKDLDLISDYKIEEINPQTEQNGQPGQPGQVQKVEQPEKGEVTKPGKKQTQTENAKIKEQPAARTPVPKPKPVKAKPESAAPSKAGIEMKGVTFRVGSFREKANASDTKKQLIERGRKAYYDLETVDGKGKFYRLYITGYKSIREGIKDAKELIKQGIITGYFLKRTAGNKKSLPHEKKQVKNKDFFLHISSMLEKADAERQVIRFKAKGYKAFFIYEKVKGKYYYRVFIGEFTSEAEARKKGAALLAKGIISYFKPMSVDQVKMKE